MGHSFACMNKTANAFILEFPCSIFIFIEDEHYRPPNVTNDVFRFVLGVNNLLIRDLVETISLINNNFRPFPLVYPVPGKVPIPKYVYIYRSVNFPC